MNPAAVLDDLRSKDAHRIWAACGAIRQSWDRASLRWLAARTDEIKAAIQGVALGGALRPNVLQLDLALRKLDLARGESCFCTLYAEDDMFSPRREAAEGHVAPGREVVDRAARRNVACTTCGVVYAVEENDGWHLPTYRWVRV